GRKGVGEGIGRGRGAVGWGVVCGGLSRRVHRVSLFTPPGGMPALTRCHDGRALVSSRMRRPCPPPQGSGVRHAPARHDTPSLCGPSRTWRLIHVAGAIARVCSTLTGTVSVRLEFLWEPSVITAL